MAPSVHLIYIKPKVKVYILVETLMSER